MLCGVSRKVVEHAELLDKRRIALEYVVYWHDVIWVGLNWHISFTLWFEVTEFIEVLIYACVCSLKTK